MLLDHSVLRTLTHAPEIGAITSTPDSGAWFSCRWTTFIANPDRYRRSQRRYYRSRASESGVEFRPMAPISRECVRGLKTMASKERRIIGVMLMTKRWVCLWLALGLCGYSKICTRWVSVQALYLYTYPFTSTSAVFECYVWVGLYVLLLMSDCSYVRVVTKFVYFIIRSHQTRNHIS